MEVRASLFSIFCSISKEHSTPSRLLSKAPFPSCKAEAMAPAQSRFLGKGELLRVSQVTSAPQSPSCEAESGEGRQGHVPKRQRTHSVTINAVWVLSHQDAFCRENTDPGSLGTWDLTCSAPFFSLHNPQVLVGHRHHLLEHSALASPINQPVPARPTSCLTSDSRG